MIYASNTLAASRPTSSPIDEMQMEVVEVHVDEDGDGGCCAWSGVEVQVAECKFVATYWRRWVASEVRIKRKQPTRLPFLYPVNRMSIASISMTRCLMCKEEKNNLN